MRILLTGKNGQLGWELLRTLAPIGQVVSFDRASLDLSSPDQIVSRVREVKPDLIVNAAAYTAVDRAESEPQLAMRINAEAPRILAEETSRLGATLIHYSTDYVFDGTKPEPYVESDPPNPLNAYGRSKLEGESGIRESGCLHLILRTSWVYGIRGRNFLLNILHLARERPELQVVSDQIGAPTWCRDLAVATARLAPAALGEGVRSLLHATCAGRTSWHGFASEILRLSGVDTPVVAISSSQYRTPARRPANSLLDNAKLSLERGIVFPSWRESLQNCLAERALPSAS